eukprot:1457327-Prymnesium_polylepis.1
MGCEIKTHEQMCSWAHYSPGVAKGGKFTPLLVLVLWLLADREAVAHRHEGLQREQKARRAAHRDADDELNPQQQHHHQELFVPPMPNHGMERAG